MQLQDASTRKEPHRIERMRGLMTRDMLLSQWRNERENFNHDLHDDTMSRQLAKFRQTGYDSDIIPKHPLWDDMDDGNHDADIDI